MTRRKRKRNSLVKSPASGFSWSRKGTLVVQARWRCSSLGNEQETELSPPVHHDFQSSSGEVRLRVTALGDYPKAPQNITVPSTAHMSTLKINLRHSIVFRVTY